MTGELRNSLKRESVFFYDPLNMDHFYCIKNALLNLIVTIISESGYLQGSVDLSYTLTAGDDFYVQQGRNREVYDRSTDPRFLQEIPDK
jgi:hypothetical protein